MAEREALRDDLRIGEPTVLVVENDPDPVDATGIDLRARPDTMFEAADASTAVANEFSGFVVRPWTQTGDTYA